MSFQTFTGNWTDLRGDGVLEIDGYHPDDEDDDLPYHERMDAVYVGALKILERARKEGYEAVLFTHGASTSRPGKTTSRSQIRKAMRSPEATLYIDRARSMQANTVFLARLKASPIK